MYKKIVSLIALLVFAAPAFMRGADKKPVDPKIKEFTGKILTRMTQMHEKYPEYNSMRKLTKKIITGMPNTHVQMRLKKIQEARRKKLNLPLVPEKKATTPKEQLQVKIGDIFERFKKNKACEKSCLICGEDRDKYPSIVLHNHTKKGVMGPLVTPHLYHAHCLFNWYNTINEDDKLDPEKELTSDEFVDIECVVCKENCEVKVAELCEKYLLWLKNTPLEERFGDLELLPRDIGLKTLEEFAKLSPEERNKICETAEGDLKIQRFIFKKLSLDLIEQDFEDGDMPEQVKQAFSLAFAIFEKRTPTTEFIGAIINFAPQEQVVPLLKLAFEHPNNSILSETEILEMADNDDDDVDAIEENINPEEEISRRQERNKKIIDLYYYDSLIDIFTLVYKKLPADIQGDYFDQLIKKAPDEDSSRKLIKTLFNVLTKKDQIAYFEGSAYTYLSKKDLKAALIRLKDDLLQVYGKEKVKEFVTACGPDSKVLNAYWDELTQENRLTIFYNILLLNGDYIGIAKAAARVCEKIKEEELPIYFGKVIDFINSKNLFDDTKMAFSDNSKMIFSQTILKKLLDLQTAAGMRAFRVFYKLVQEKVKIAANRDFELRYLLEQIWPILTNDHDKMYTFTILLNNLTTEWEKKYALKKWWDTLPRELRRNIAEEPLIRHTSKTVSTSAFLPFQKDSINKPLAVGGMLCSLTNQLKKVHETEKMIEGIKK